MLQVSSLPFSLVLEWFQVVCVEAVVANILSRCLYAAQKRARHFISMRCLEYLEFLVHCL